LKGSVATSTDCLLHTEIGNCTSRAKSNICRIALQQDLEQGRNAALQDGDLDLANVHLPLPEDEEGILEYKFPKFAATHFQDNATPTFVRRPLRQSLLQLKNEGDELVS